MNSYLGRLKIIQKLLSKKKFSLSVGSRETTLAEINVDIDPLVHPDIISDARFLPFRDCVFQQLLFTDVIEHLPENDEPKALREIWRVLHRGDNLILTSPANSTLYTFLDPAKYLRGHRHYKQEGIKDMLEINGFEIETIFTAGGLWTWFNNLWYCLITYPLKKITMNPRINVPSFLQVREDQEYNLDRRNGYTIFVRAIRKSAR